jgi:hypothetical protein
MSSVAELAPMGSELNNVGSICQSTCKVKILRNSYIYYSEQRLIFSVLVFIANIAFVNSER